MGDYTQFGASIKLKSEHVQTIQALLASREDPNGSWSAWQDIDLNHPDYGWFAAAPDAHMIPFGSGQAGDPCFQFLNDNGVFNFACSLKNRGGIIAEFMRIVLPVIAESAELFDHYCNDTTPNRYVFADGVLVQIEKATYEL